MSIYRSASQSHVCSLKSPNHESALPRNASTWLRFKQQLQNLTLISEKYPKTCIYFKSKASIAYERRRHLKSKYAYIIHPFSLLRVYWEVWMLIIYVVTLTFFPWMIAFEPYNYTGLVLFLDVCGWVDIFLNFLTGVFKRTYCEVVLSVRDIAGSYLSSYFIFDVLSTLTIDFQERFGYEPFIPFPLGIFRLLKIFRLRTVLDYMTTTVLVLKLPYGICKIIKFNFLCFLTLHWTGCAHYIVPKIMAKLRGHWHEKSWIWEYGLTMDDSNLVRYIYCLFRAACCIFCVDIPRPAATEDIILSWVSFLYGKLFGTYLMVVWLQMFLLAFGNEAKHQDIITQLNEYMRSEKLPLDLQKRMLSYYNYRYKDGYFRSSAINATLSDNLKREISTYCCRNLIEKVNIFKDLPEEVLQEMIKRMENEIYLPNDIIIKAGSPGRCMYFLVSGTVAVFTTNGKEICHLQDGSFFGEIALMVKDHKRIATVIALEICTVYTLDKRHFRHAFEHYPELLLLIQEEANHRMENTIRMEALHKKLLEGPNRRLMLRSSQY